MALQVKKCVHLAVCNIFACFKKWDKKIAERKVFDFVV
jgi:hypothetical protein